MAVKRSRSPAFPPVPEQLDRIRMGAVELIREEELEKKLTRSRRSRTLASAQAWASFALGDSANGS